MSRLLTTREVAEIVSMTPETVLRWHRAGIGPPALKLPSGALRFRADALDAWLVERATQTYPPRIQA